MNSKALELAKRPVAEILALFVLASLTLLFYWKILLTGRILVDYDLFTYFYPYKAYAAATLTEGRLPLWNPYLFMGVPFLANIQTAIFYPFNLMTIYLDPPQAVNLSTATHVFLAGVLMYAFARVSVKLDRLSSLVAAIVFMFGGFLSAQVGHINQLNTSIWLPLLFLFFDLAYRRRSLVFTLLGSAVVGIQILAGHPQEVYLTLFGLGLFALFSMVREVMFGPSVLDTERHLGDRGPNRAKGVLASAVWALACYFFVVALGFGLAAVQLAPTLELSGESIRAGALSYDDATSFSLAPWNLVQALLPGFWDNPFSEFVAYIGVVPLVLVGAAVSARRHRAYAILCLLMMLFALFFALGRFNPVYPDLLRFVPGLNLFRVPARWLYLYTFGASVAAGIGLRGFLQPRRPGQSHRSWKTLVGFIWLTVPLVVVGVLWSLRRWVLLPSFEVLAIWVSLACVAIAARLCVPMWAPGAVPAAVVASTVVVELFLAGRGLGFNKTVAPQAYSSLRPSISHLLTDEGDFRILSVANADYDPGDKVDLELILNDQLPTERIYDFIVNTKYKEVLTPNIPMTYGIATVDGYDGGVLPLGRYIGFKQLLLESGGLKKGWDPIQSDALLRHQLAGIPDTELLGALNVKYVIADKGYDVWLDYVYYDLATTVGISSWAPAELSSLPPFEATSLGLVAYLDGCDSVPQGVPVAAVTIANEYGETITAELKAGIDTAEGDYDRSEAKIAHSKARIASSWIDDDKAFNYLATIDFGHGFCPQKIEVEYLLPTGSLYLRGASLIDNRTLASESLVPNQRLELVHSGDVKIYRNLDYLPRAFLVHKFDVAKTLEETMAVLREDIQRTVVLREPPDIGESSLLAMKTASLAVNSPDRLQITSHEPERMRMEVELAAPGFLVLSDAYYPGWRAWIDGVRTEILPADWLFRAIYVPAGRHAVEFRYEPASLAFGWLVTRVSLVVLVVSLGLALLWARLGR